MKKFLSILAILALVFSPSTPVFAASANWTGGDPVNANWTDTDNWSATPVPGANDTATFNAHAGAGGATITLGGEVSIAGIVFNNVDSIAAYLIGKDTFGEDYFILKDGGAIVVNPGVDQTQTIQADVLLSPDATFTNNAGAGVLLNVTGYVQGHATNAGTLTLNGSNTGYNVIAGNILHEGAALSVLKAGVGTWVLSGTNTYTGGTTVQAGGGMLAAFADASALGTGTVTMEGGTLWLVNDIGLGFGNAVHVTGNAEIDSDTNTAVAGVTHSLGVLTVGSHTLTLGLAQRAASGTQGLTFGGVILEDGGTTLMNVSVGLGGAGGLLTLGAIDGTTTGAESLTIDAGAAAVTFSDMIGSNIGLKNLDVTAAAINLSSNIGTENGSVHMHGAVTITDLISIDTLGLAGTGADVNFASTVNGIAAGTEFLTITAGTGTVTFAGLVGNSVALGALDVTGTAIHLGGNIGTEDGYIYMAGAVTLTNSIAMDTNGVGTGADVNFTSAVDGTVAGTQALTVTAGTGAVTFDAAVGSTVKLGQLNVTGASININGGAIKTQAGAGGDGSQNYNGATVLGAGATLTSTGNINLDAVDNNNFLLTVDAGGAASEISGVVSGGGGLTQAGAGTLTLGSASTYTGATNVTGGTLKAGVAAAFSAGSTTTVSAVGTLDLNNFDNTVNSLSGAAGSQVLLDSKTLTTGDATDTTFAGVISETGNLVKQGGGALTLSGANTYSGTTTVTGGTLTLSHASSNNIANSTTINVAGGAGLNTALLSGGAGLTLASGQTLKGSGTVTGGLTIGTNSVLKPGNSPGTLTDVGNVTYAGGGKYVWEINDATGAQGTNWDFQNITGGLTISSAPGSTFAIDITSLTLGNVSGDAANFNKLMGYTWTIASASTGIAGFDAGDFTLNYTSATFKNDISGSVTPGSFIIQTSGNNLQLKYNAAVDAPSSNWTGGGVNALWSNTANWSGAAVPGANATFNAAAGAGGALIDLGGSVAIGSVIFDTADADAYTIGIAGVDTLTLANGGGIVVNNLVDQTQTIAAHVVLSPNGSFSNNGANDGFLLNVTGNVTGGGVAGTLTLNGSDTGNNTVSGIIANGAGVLAVTKSEAGTWVLSGANTYTGATNVTGGTLKAGVATTAFGVNSAVTLSNVAGAILNLNDLNQTIGSLNGGGATGGNVSLGAGTLTTGALNTADNYGGVISGTGGLTKDGTSTFNLNGANTYDGVTTINGGTVMLGNAAGLGSTLGHTVVSAGNVAALDLNGQTVVGEAVMLNGTGVSNGGALLNGTGTASLSGLVTLATDSTITSTGAGGLTLTGGINNGGHLLTLNGANATVVSTAAITGAGGLTKEGAGTLTLSAVNNYDGATTINGGKVSIGADSGLGTAPVGATAGHLTFDGGTLESSGTFALATTRGIALTGAGTIDVKTGQTLTYDGVIAGAGTLSKMDTGTLILGGANVYTGATTVSNGTVSVATIKDGGIAGGLGAATSAAGNLVFDDAALRYTGATDSTNRNFTVNTGKTATLDIVTNDLTMSGGAAATTGALTKTGAGKLILTGAHLNTGITTVTTGTLQVGAGGLTGTLGSGAITDNAALVFNRSNALGVANNISGTGTLEQAGSGALTLSGTNTHSGGTTLSAGTLNINSTTALGATASAFTIAGGTTIDNTTAGALTLANNNAQNWNGDFAFTGTQNLGLGTGAVTLSANRQVTVNANTLNVGGAIGDGGGARTLTKLGNGTLTLSGTVANTYSGLTTVSAGELDLSKTALTNAIAGDLTISGGTVKWLNDNQIANTATVNMTSGALNLNGMHETVTAFSNSGGTFATGTGHLTATGATVTWSGGTNTINDGGVVEDGHIVITGGTNTVQGGVTGGVLQLNTGGTGLAMSNGSTLTLNSAMGVAGKLLLKGDVSTSGATTVTIASGLALTNKGTVDLNGGTSTFTVADGAAAEDLSVSAVIANGALTKAGAGTMALSAANTYTGATNVTNGTLKAGVVTTAFGVNSAVNLSDVAGAVLDLNGLSQTIGSLNGGGATGGNVSLGAGTLTTGALNTADSCSGVISGGGGLTKTGTSSLTLNKANTYTGTTAVQRGTLKAGVVTTAFGVNSAVNLSDVAGAVLDLNGLSQTIGSLNGGGATGGNVFLGAGTLTTGALNTADSYSGVISGGGGLTKTGTSSLTLNKANTYTGTTSVQNGTLRAGVATTAFGVNSAVTLTNTALAVLDLNGLSQTIGSLNGGGAAGGNVSLGVGTLTTGALNTVDSYGGVISGGGGLTKAGTNTLTLTKANTYSGTTTVSAGTLALSNATSTNNIANSTTINVASGAGLNTTLLSGGGITLASGQTLKGSGTVTGGLTVGTGSFINPGNSPGTLTDVGNVTYDGGGTYVWEINDATGTKGAATGWDWQNITGAGNTLTINGAVGNTFKIDITSLSGTNPGNAANFDKYANYTWIIASAAGGVSGFNANEFLVDATHFSNSITGTASNGSFGIQLSGLNDLQLAYTAAVNVPSSNWTGGSANALWSNTANWSGGIVPGTGNDATFNAVAGVGGAVINLSGGVTVKNIIFDTLNAAAYTIGVDALGTDAIILNNNGGITVNAGVVKTQTIQADVFLSPNGTFTNNGANDGFLLNFTGWVNGDILGNLPGTLTLNGSDTGNNTISGEITNGGTGALAVTKSGVGAWVLSGANTYTGVTTVSAGTLVATTNAEALGAGTLTLSGGTLSLANNTGLNFGRAVTVTGDATINSDTLTAQAGVIHTLGTLSIGNNTLTIGLGTTATSTQGLIFGATTLTGNATINANEDASGGLLTLTTVTGAGRNLTIGGTADTAVTGAITTTTGTLTKNGTGTLTLNGVNTYTGVTTINAGTLSVATLGDGGVAGNLGQATSAVGNQVLAGGTLSYTGATATTNRGFTVNAAGGEIDVTTTGNTLTINTTGIAAAGTLTIGGAGNTTISSAISGAGGVTKDDAGTLTLSGANVYTGTTTINAGILALMSGADLTTSALITFKGDALLGLSDGSNITSNITNTQGAANNGNITTLGNSVITGAVGAAGVGRLGSLTINGASGTTAEITLATYATDATIGAGTLKLDTTSDITTTSIGAGTLNLTGAADLAGTTITFTGDGLINLSAGSDITANVTNTSLSANNGNIATAGNSVITGAVGSAGLGRLGSLTISGAGGTTAEITLAAYATDATIDVGELQLDSDSNITTTTVGAGTLDLNGSLTGNINFSGAGATGNVAIANTKNITGTITTSTTNTGILTVEGATLLTGNVGTASNLLKAITINNGANLSVANGFNLYATGINGAAAGQGTLTYVGSSATGNAIGATNGLAAVNVDGGTLTLGHNISAITTNLNGFGNLTLNGNRTLTGNLKHAGTSSLTLGTNTLSLGGTGVYTLAAGQTLNVSIMDPATFGKILASGNAAVTGGTVHVTVGSSSIANGTSFLIIDGAGGGDISGLTVTDNSVVLDFTGSSGLPDYTLTAVRVVDYASVSTNGNIEAVGKVLDGIAASGATGDMLNVLTTLDGMSSTQEIANSLATMTPDVSSGAMQGTRSVNSHFVTAISNRLSFSRSQFATTGIASGDMFQGAGFWLQGIGGHESQGERGGIEGYSANTFGTTMGFDKLLGEHFRAGLAGGYGFGAINSKTPGSPSTNINSWQATVYGSYDSVNLNKARQSRKYSRTAVRNQEERLWYVDGMLTFSQNDYDSRRDIFLGPSSRTAKADHYGQQYSTKLETGYTLLFEKTRNLEITPFASLGYNYLYMNKYKEHGADSLDLSVAGAGFNQLEQGLGLKLAYPVVCKGTGTFIPSIKGAWLFDYLAQKFETSASFAGGGSSFSTYGVAPARNAFLLGSEIAFLNRGNMTLTGNFDLEFREAYTGFTYYLTLRYDF